LLTRRRAAEPCFVSAPDAAAAVAWILKRAEVTRPGDTSQIEEQIE